MHSPVHYSESILECQSQTGLNSEHLICIWKIKLNDNHCNLHSYRIDLSFHNSLFWTTSNSGFELFHTRLSGLKQLFWLLKNSENIFFGCVLTRKLLKWDGSSGDHLVHPLLKAESPTWSCSGLFFSQVFCIFKDEKATAFLGNLIYCLYINILTVTNYRTWDYYFTALWISAAHNA